MRAAVAGAATDTASVTTTADAADFATAIVAAAAAAANAAGYSTTTAVATAAVDAADIAVGAGAVADTPVAAVAADAAETSADDLNRHACRVRRNPRRLGDLHDPHLLRATTFQRAPNWSSEGAPGKHHPQPTIPLPRLH